MEKNTVKEIFKSGLGLVAGIGIGIMVKTGVGMLTPETAGKLTKLCCNAGGLVLASALGRVADNEINKIDEGAQKFKNSIMESYNKIVIAAAKDELGKAAEKVKSKMEEAGEGPEDEEYLDEPCSEPAE